MPATPPAQELAPTRSERLDRLPRVGDVVVVDTFDTANRDSDDLPTPARVRLEVEEVANNRVESLSVTTVPQEDSDDAGVRAAEDRENAGASENADSDVIHGAAARDASEEAGR